jgi:predicted ATPase
MHYIRTGVKPPEDEIVPEIEFSVKSRIHGELKVRAGSGQSLQSLASSGFGYSQLLPILVNGLLPPPGPGPLIIEQPELHLNPALQVRLAEFLALLARNGLRDVIIETHSEHLVNAVRVLAAEGALDESLCKVYFIDVETDRPAVHEMTIDSAGTIADWPRNFFGEVISLTNRLLRAQRRRRNAQQEGE